MDFSDYVPSVSVDCVVFGFHQNQLKVLMLKLKHLNLWALPGGFIKINQSATIAADKVLKDRTGLEGIYQQQFHVFTDPERSQTSHIEQLITNDVLDKDVLGWFKNRFISIGYYALVEYSKVNKPEPDFLSEKCQWVSLDELPELMLDHEEIIKRAYVRLKQDLYQKPVGINLLPEKFTMPELQALYETILQKKIDRRNFRRKILSLNILIDTKEKRMGSNNRAPIVYKFDKTKYHQVLKEGYHINLF
ncbi:NUDIX domain-containing protein [Marivirga tractuosa]|uniref:NUDIX hydrolase n=1 Tax=Marivirga tractuosa TaxID=1006 RepID=UPI0035CFC5B2